jgi:hypothetical protein
MVPGGDIDGLDSILHAKIRSIFAVILCRVGLIVKDKNGTNLGARTLFRFCLVPE